MQLEAIAQLERHHTALVLWGEGAGFDDVPQASRLPLLARYISSNFEPASRPVDRIVLWKRRR